MTPELKNSDIPLAVFDFIENHYPKYHSSEEIALYIDLLKLEEEYRPDEVSSENQTLYRVYGGDLEKALNDLDRVHVNILHKAIENSKKTKHRVVFKLPDEHPLVSIYDNLNCRKGETINIGQFIKICDRKKLKEEGGYIGDFLIYDIVTRGTGGVVTKIYCLSRIER